MKVWNAIFGDDGLLWSVKAGYRFVNPRGIKGHIKFLLALPRTTYVYMRLRAKDHKVKPMSP